MPGPPRLLICCLLAAAVLAAGAPAAAATAEPGDIAQETLRSSTQGSGVVQAWWLPVEYWSAAAERQKWSPERQKDLKERMASYLVLAVIEARVEGAGLSFSEHREMAERFSLERNGKPVEVLRKFDPVLTQLVPELSYFMRISTGPLAEGVRLFFFPNVDGGGKPVLNGGSAGELRLRYRASDGGRSDFRWHAPLSAVAGRRPCPKGGEPLEASWKFCPWHGVPVP